MCSRGIAERGALAPLFVLIDCPARVSAAVGHALASRHHFAGAARPTQVRTWSAKLAARHALPKEVVEECRERTGGVPLFVEEVTRLLLERGEQGMHPGDPADAATIADGTARPPRPGARGSADRFGDWA